MRNKILLAVLVALVFTLGVLSVKAYDQNKHDRAAKAQAASQAQAAAEQTEAQRAKAEMDEKMKYEEGCHAGLAAYNKLTPAQQKGTQKPVCDLPQLQ